MSLKVRYISSQTRLKEDMWLTKQGYEVCGRSVCARVWRACAELKLATAQAQHTGG